MIKTYCDVCKAEIPDSENESFEPFDEELKRIGAGNLVLGISRVVDIDGKLFSRSCDLCPVCMEKAVKALNSVFENG